jgi:arylformamidase
MAGSCRAVDNRHLTRADERNIAMLYDISPPISPGIAVWPGDTLFARELLMDMKRGDNITLSTLRTTCHLGAHADAPNHYGRDAPGIDARSLNYYLGPCQLMRIAVGRGDVLGPGDIKQSLRAQRLLLATGTFPDPTHFNEDFAALAPELVEWLHDQEVLLVGIDTPSVDPFTSKELPAHRQFLRHDMAILEGLVLGEVPEGLYELIALPLRLVDADASPVRAVLRTLDQ